MMNEQLGLKERIEPEAQNAETALATTSQNVPATIPEIPAELSMEGMEGIDQSDLMVPRVRVLQPTSKLPGEAGEFHFNLTDTTKKTVVAVLLRVQKGRVMWNPDDLAAAPVCASDDDKMPRAGGTYANPCADCPMAKWGADSTPPACSQTYNFLAADTEDDNAPFMISLSKTSLKHGKRIISVFVLKHKPLYSAPVRLMSTLVTSDKGKWYEVTFTPSPAKGFDWRPYREMYLGMRAMELRTDTEQTSSQEARDQPATPSGGLDEEELPF
jgi:hypothetical protein